MDLSARTLWPLFPLLLMIVVVCLTWALVYVVRRESDRLALWLQAGALVCYLLAAAAAIASESGGISAQVHRPFSLLTQILIAWSLIRLWRRGRSPLILLNV